MNKSTSPSERARFGTFELNVRTGELISFGTAAEGAEAPKVLLREQPFRILRILVQRKGDVVTREEIREILWPNDTFVDFDRSINVAMTILRKALGDDAEHPIYIETLARRGYRLIAPVEWQPSSTAAQDLVEPQGDTPRNEPPVGDPEVTTKHWPRAVIICVFATTLVVGGYISWRRFRNVNPPPSKKIMLAVLPFENLTGDPQKDYLADGMTEEMISQLGRLNPEQLGVIARTSVMGYKHKDERLDQIGRDLSVQYVLENSLRQSGDHLRLTAQLIQVKDQSHLWSHDYDYAAKDILSVQSAVAKAVAREIQLRFTSQQQADQTRPANPEAFDAYLQGYYFFERNTSKDTDMAAKYYEKATQLDPAYALAWVGLSRARNWQADIGLIPAQEGHRLAREAVERALALNPNLAAAHSQLGRIKRQVNFDWTGADVAIQKAIALEPGNPEFVRSAAFTAVILGRFDEALQLSRRAVDLDPLNAGSWENLGEIEFFMGRLDDAVADIKKALELNTDNWNGHFFLSEIYIMQGRPQDALPEIARLQDRGGLPLYLNALAYHALGREKESDAALKELIAKYQTIDTYIIAVTYAFRNQPDEAFKWLDRAYAEHNDGLIATKIDPLLKNLHNDPRFAALLKKLNLPN